MTEGADTLRTSLEKFIDHVNTLEEEDDPMGNGFDREYKKLRDIAIQQKDDDGFSVEEGRKPHNIRKNRYKDILPFDETRVVLDDDDPENNYINANFIKDYRQRFAYIGSQGPLPHTVDDFWRMIWMYDAKVVIMACKEEEHGRKKCQRYWPLKPGEKEEYGSIIVTLESEGTINEYADDCIVRKLLAECGTEKQHVVQYQYTGWPDHGIPDDIDIILEMIAEMRKIRETDPDRSPAVIHCSAGCGRTGTITAIDYAWEVLKTGNLEDDFNLYEIIKAMREQRQSMVQTPDQYKMAHVAVKQLFEEHLDMMEDHIYSNMGEQHDYYNDVNTATATATEVPETVESPYEPVYIGQDVSDSGRVPSVDKTRGTRRTSETVKNEVKAALKHYYDKTDDEPPSIENKPMVYVNVDLKSDSSMFVKEKTTVLEEVEREDVKHVRSGPPLEQNHVSVPEKNEVKEEQMPTKASNPVVQSSAPPRMKKPSISDLMGVFEKSVSEERLNKPVTTPTSPKKLEHPYVFQNQEMMQGKEQQSTVKVDQANLKKEEQKVAPSAPRSNKSSTSSESNISVGDKKVETKPKLHVTTITISQGTSTILSQGPEAKKTVSSQNSTNTKENSEDLRAKVSANKNTDAIYSEVPASPKSHFSGVRRKNSNRMPQQQRASYLEEVKIASKNVNTSPVNSQEDSMYSEVRVHTKSAPKMMPRIPSEDVEGPPVPHRGYQEETEARESKEENGQTKGFGKKLKALFSGTTSGAVTVYAHESASRKNSKIKGFGIRVDKPKGPRPQPAQWNRTSN